MPIWAYNFGNSTYSLPLGVGIGQVITGERVVFNVFEEPQGSTADKGPGWPQRQIFAGFSIQFNK